MQVGGQESTISRTSTGLVPPITVRTWGMGRSPHLNT